MSTPHDATLSFSYASTERAAIVARSVSQEQGEIEGDRTTASVSREGPVVEVAVAAEDLVALRAGCNTWTSLVTVAERLATPDGR